MPYVFSSIIIVFLLVVFRIVQVKFQPDSSQKQNRLTLLPLAICGVYLLAIFANNLLSSKLIIQDDEVGRNLLKEKIIYIGGAIECFFWSALIFVICFEWQIITSLVEFQSSCSL